MKVFEYILVHKPKDKVEDEVIIAGPRAVLAIDQAKAGQIAAREIPNALSVNEVEIFVRPFA